MNLASRNDISEFTEQDSRKERTQCDKRDRSITYVFCQEFTWNWFFLLFYKKICLKECEVWRKVFLCHACHTRLAVVLPLPSCWITNLVLNVGMTVIPLLISFSENDHQVPEIREKLVKENQGKWEKIAKYQKRAFFSPTAEDIKRQAKT